MKRVHIASIRNSPRPRARLTTASASRRFMANGFSHSTGLPASSASKAFCACMVCGVATYTMSTSGIATSAS